jgi:hypothetical protein
LKIPLGAQVNYYGHHLVFVITVFLMVALSWVGGAWAIMLIPLTGIGYACVCQQELMKMYKELENEVS